MAYTTKRSGFTGPSAKIGGSTDYHQDLKLLESLPIAERVKMIDAIALQNQAIGREIEFSNPAVSGKRWNLTADLSDKIDLLNRAAGAHSHSRHSGWQSFDYYTPFKGKSRFDKGAVEDASIYLPVAPGGKVRRGSGGGYGYYSEALDPQGRVIARVGHGNIDRPEADTEVLVPAAATTTPGTTTTQEAAVDKDDFLAGYLKDMLKQNLISGILSPQSSGSSLDLISEMMQYAPKSPLVNPLMGQ
jgi:hypothetical protein